MNEHEVVIIGGGLAGLTAALEFTAQDVDVLVLEKGEYPRHKVCGEYVSKEVLPYLQRMGVDPMKEGAKAITRFEISAPSGKISSTELPLGGFGISRFKLDDLMMKKAEEAGAKIREKTEVTDVQFQGEIFLVTTKKGDRIPARQVIGAFGKRSVLDRKMNRKFFEQKTDYVGVKHHFEGDFPEDLVALHNFKGGYCGLSKVETDRINVCYLTTTKIFKKHGSIEELESGHLSANPHLAKFFNQSKSIFEKPLVISQISFAGKKPVENHVLMCGDSAGLISPLCGNGMAMAIRAGKMAAEETLKYLDETTNRQQMESAYEKRWKMAFNSRLRFGRMVQPLFGKPAISNLGLVMTKAIPGILPTLIRQSHGSEF